MAEESKTSKRRVRNPETFRERALKAAESDAKPATASRVKNTAGKVARPVASPFAKVGRFLGKFRILRILGRILWPKYFRESFRELTQVAWPNWQQSRQLTFAVIVFAAIFGAAIAGVDYGLDKIFRHILLK